MRRAAWAAAPLGLGLLLAGCALSGNPQPPTLSLPEPVRNLSAKRLGDEVHLQWIMPRHTTDKVELEGEQRAQICWIDGLPAAKHITGPLPGCHAAGSASFTPDKPAAYTTTLPADLADGAPRLVSFFVELENAAGKTAGPSNAALVAAGTAPAAVTGLRLETRANGVVLHWTAEAAEAGLAMHIHREMVHQPKPAKPVERNGVPPAATQLLEVNLSPQDPGGAVDEDAALDHVWRYWTERVQRVTIDGHALEIAGIPSETLTIDAKDIFPPPVPAGLAAIADDQARSIDLSWTPDMVANLAGYFVYRRDVTAGTAGELISGKAPLVAPAFDDRDVLPGHQYAYSVSAEDRDGNESARSAEVEEGLPQ